jgi:hypothetical protein
MDHPITPPLEMRQLWVDLWHQAKVKHVDLDVFVAIQAARWGWDQRSATVPAELQQAQDEELEACCEWLYKYQYDKAVVLLLAARRPKPPSLKRLALDQLKALELHGALDCNTIHIRRALETLPND